MSRYTALYDACVLYPAPLRDILMQLALSDLFHARWTADIHREWMLNVHKDRPDLKQLDLQKTRELMDKNVRDCLITGYKPLIKTITLPDKNDRHVLAAAIRGRADVIVTFNLKDFPASALKPYDIEVQHPDEFMAHLIDLEPRAVLEAAKSVRFRLKNPPKSATEYVETLSRQGLSKTAYFLAESANLI